MNHSETPGPTDPMTAAASLPGELPIATSSPVTAPAPTSASAGVSSLEIERKYEVAATTPIPAAEVFERAGFTADPPDVTPLVARYFDGQNGELAQRGMAVRVREGGKDAGWHLKQRGAAGVREVFWPLSAELPRGLRDELVAVIGETATDALRPIAELRTERTVLVLREHGIPVVECADDRVSATSYVEQDTGEVRRAWREWEAELLQAPAAGGAGADSESDGWTGTVGDAGAAVLDRVEAVLRAAGATPSLSFAKIARATGQLLPLARAAGVSADRVAALSALDAADRAAGDAASSAVFLGDARRHE